MTRHPWEGCCGVTARYRAVRDDADEGSESRQRLKQFAYDLALLSFERYVQLLEVDRTEQLIEVSKVILDKLVALCPVSQSIRTVYELLHAFEEIERVSTSDTRPLTTTAKTLSGLELFLMMSLVTARWAVAQTHALTDPSSEDSSTLPREQLVTRQLGRAGCQISEMIIRVRHDLRDDLVSQGLVDVSIPFPREGLWPFVEETDAA